MDTEFLLRVPEFYRGLPHQKDTLRWIWGRLNDNDKREAFRRWHTEKHGGSQVATRALFKLPAQKSTSLIWGNFFLFDRQNNQIFDGVATSGAGGYQSLTDQWRRGVGLMPALKNLTLDTQGYHLDTPGIEGWFYPIFPLVMVRAETGAMRSEIGLHLDANFQVSPGSAGCIVLRSPDSFNILKRVLRNTYQAGVTRIPLTCDYSGGGS